MSVARPYVTAALPGIAASGLARIAFAAGINSALSATPPLEYKFIWKPLQIFCAAGSRSNLQLWVGDSTRSSCLPSKSTREVYTTSPKAMVLLETNVDAAVGAKDAPRHASSGREMLDVPERGSGLADRLTVLNVGARKEKPRLACDASSRQGNSGVSVVGAVHHDERLGWESGKAGAQKEGPTLMEQMMADALAAKADKAEERRQEERRDTKKHFGGGLKKGFLSGASGSSSTAGKSKKGNRVKKEQPNSRSTSKGDSQSSGTAHTAANANETMPVVSGRRSSAGGLEFDVSAEGEATKAGLVLPEVQEAMRRAADTTGRAGGGSREGNSADWLTPELLDKISAKPRLAAMLTDPRFAKAMQLMSTSPKDALGMFASSPEARDSFTELMALLADHFTGMGEAADTQAKTDEADRQRVADGPLAQEALRQAARGEGVAASPATAEEAANVEEVLQQPELRELLMDPGMQRVLQECGEPAALARYMRHPEYGPKLQLMARAGLVSFRS